MDEQEVQQLLKKKDLKIQGLLERVGEQAAQYENTIADLRVTLTEQEEYLKFLQGIPHGQANDIPQVVPGEVVSDDEPVE